MNDPVRYPFKTDKEKLEIVASNLEGFWASVSDDLKSQLGEKETSKILHEDAACLREIAGRMP